MSEDNKDSIKNNVIKAIQDGKVAMRPKWHFILNAGLLFIGTVLALLALVYLVSFIIFAQSVSHNVTEMLETLPWIVVFLAVVFIIIVEILVRRYSFSYRKPLLYTTLGILALVVLTGFIISRTGLHDDLSDRAHRGELPFGGEIYRRYDHRLPRFPVPQPDSEIYPTP